MTPEVLALGVLWYLVFILSTTCHEGAHALVAKLGGDETALEGGQVTLNPVPHIRREPFGTVVVPVLSYFMSGFMIGWASTPYDPAWEHRYPRRAGLMALAGPAANLLLALIAVIAIKAGVAAGTFEPPSQAGFSSVVGVTGNSGLEAVATFLSILLTLNLLLALFNMLPVPPLDGSSAIGLILPTHLARRYHEAMRRPQLAIIGLLAAWWGFGYIFSPIFTLMLNVLYPDATYR